MSKDNKKKTEQEKTSSSVDDIFSQLITQHNNKSPYSATIGTDMNSAVTHWIDSGSLLLNMILSNKPDGGWPAGRIVEVFGKENIGKSTLGYCAMRGCQKAGGIVIYADIERAGNPQFMEMLGLDLSKTIITYEETVETLFEALEANLNTIAASNKYNDKPVLIVLDSLTALQTNSELEGGYEFNMNVSLAMAKQLGKAFKKLLPSLNKANACLYVVNQIRDNVSGYGPSYTTGGGKALKFYASIRVYLEGKEKILVKDPVIENEFQLAMAAWKEAGGKKSGREKPERPKMDETTVGYTIAAYTIKNKVAPQDRRAHFQILFSEGLKDEECYLDYAEKYGIIKKSGAYYSIVGFDNDCGKFYASEWLQILSDHDVYSKLVAMLIDKLTIKMVGGNYVTAVEAMNEDERRIIESLKKEQSAAEIELVNKL